MQEAGTTKIQKKTYPRRYINATNFASISHMENKNIQEQERTANNAGKELPKHG